MEKIQDSIDASSESPVIPLFIAGALGLIHWPLIALVWVGCMIRAPMQVRNHNHRLRRSVRSYVR